MLGGGDLDGDEYFVSKLGCRVVQCCFTLQNSNQKTVYEREIVETIRQAEPYDFGTQNLSKTYEEVLPLCAPTEDCAPNINDQYGALEDLMRNGNLVSMTAEARLRLADKYGIADENVQKIANLHQRALDRKECMHS